MKPGRAKCCIIGCNRTRRLDLTHIDMEWDEHMCREHYQSVDKDIRMLRSRLVRIARKQGFHTAKMIAMDNRLWARAKRQATERQLGI